MHQRRWVTVGLALGLVVVLVALARPFGGDSNSVAAQAGVVSPPELVKDPAPTAQELSVTTPPEPQPGIDIPDLVAGGTAPQMVVLSFDGGVEARDGIMAEYLDLARANRARFSFYVSATYLIPDGPAKMQYRPPRKPAGTSAIGFAAPELIGPRIDTLGAAWNEGHEVGTHFMGHFCGPGGVSSWSQSDWTSEINQFNFTIDNWHAFSPDVSAGPLPFNSTVVKGGRTPCLEGKRPAMHKAFVNAGYSYDSSDTGTLQWPKKSSGLWLLPLPTLQVGSLGRVLAMDYNYMVNQNGGKTEASPERCAAIEDETYESYVGALNDLRQGNRAPLLIGSHMNRWVCNAYTAALHRFVRDTRRDHPDVLFVSALDLVEWLERQDPQLLAELQALPPE